MPIENQISLIDPKWKKNNVLYYILVKSENIHFFNHLFKDRGKPMAFVYSMQVF